MTEKDRRKNREKIQNRTMGANTVQELTSIVIDRSIKTEQAVLTENHRTFFQDFNRETI